MVPENPASYRRQPAFASYHSGALVWNDSSFSRRVKGISFAVHEFVSPLVLVQRQVGSDVRTTFSLLHRGG